MKRILSDDQERLLTDERRVLGDLQVVLAGSGASEEAQATLAQSVRQLDELFLLVVVGEFNGARNAVAASAAVGAGALGLPGPSSRSWRRRRRPTPPVW